MNKAFTRESDEEPDEPLAIPRSAQLPPGTPNYVTADGALRIREELSGLEARVGAQTAPVSDAEAKRALLRVEQRIQYLRDCLRTAVPVNAAEQPGGKVCFGATVSIRDHAGAEFSYRIVGVDEIDLNRGWISWLSPIARALLNANEGDTIRFKTPKGEEQLLVTGIGYECA